MLCLFYTIKLAGCRIDCNRITILFTTINCLLILPKITLNQIMSKNKIAKNTGSMSIAVFLSRILGLVRDILMTNFFGTSYVADAFQVAYQLPNLLRKLFGEGALSAAFVPLYAEIGVKEGRARQISFALNILSVLCAFLLLLSGLGMLLAPLIVKLFAPGFDPVTSHLAAKLTRIMFPYLLLIGFSSTLISILNSHDYFFLPGLSSAFLNIGMILTLGVFLLLVPVSSHEEKIVIWSIGVILGGLLQTIINFPILKKIGYRFRLILDTRNEAIKVVWQRFLPGVWGLAVRQVNLAVDMILASLLATGSIAALNYGNRLMQLPLGIIGVSAGVAVLPLFSRYIAEERWDDLQEGLRFSLLSIAYIMVPVTALMIIFGKDLISIIFLRGAFNENSLHMTYQAFIFYSLGLTVFSMNRVIIPVFYAHKDTRTPVKISVVIVIANIILNLILMQFLQHAGLALATSISALLQLFILNLYIRRKYTHIVIRSLIPSLLKIFLLTVLVSFCVFLAVNYFPVEGKFMLLIRLVILGSIFLIVYLTGSILLKIEYSRETLRSLWKKIRR